MIGRQNSDLNPAVHSIIWPAVQYTLLHSYYTGTYAEVQHCSVVFESEKQNNN